MSQSTDTAFSGKTEALTSNELTPGESKAFDVGYEEGMRFGYAEGLKAAASAHETKAPHCIASGCWLERNKTSAQKAEADHDHMFREVGERPADSGKP